MPIVAATALAAVAVLSGCSSSSGTQGSNHITLQTWADTQYAKLQGQVYNKSHPKDPVVLKVTAAATDVESVNKFRLALSSGKNIPDILQLNYGSLAEFADAGVLADVKPYVDKYLGNVSPAGKKLMQYNGKYVAFPYEVKSKLWFYRSDLFDQAGIDVSKIKNQADFIAAGNKLKQVAPKSNMWNLGPNPQPYDLGMIVSGNGAKYSERKPSCKVTVGTDAGLKKAFMAMKDLKKSGVLAPVDDFTPEWQAGLADGTIASTLQASWFPTFLEQYAPALAGKWKVTTWPEIGGAKGGSESGGSVFVIPAASKNKEAAAAFLAGSLLEKNGAKAYIDARGGAFPTAVSSLVNDSFSSSKYFGPSLGTAFAESTGSQFKIFPFDPAANKESTSVVAALVNYLASNSGDPSQFLNTAQAELAAQVGCPYGK